MPRGQLVRMAAGATKSFCKPNILVLGCRIRPACGKLFVGKWIMVCFLSLRTEPDEQHLNSVPFFPSFLSHLHVIKTIIQMGKPCLILISISQIYVYIFYIMHLADAFIQSDLQCNQAIHLYFINMRVPWELKIVIW